MLAIYLFRLHPSTLISTPCTLSVIFSTTLFSSILSSSSLPFCPTLLSHHSYSLLSYPILFYSLLSYPILFYSLLSYPILFYSLLSFPILFYSLLSYPILFYSLLSYPTSTLFQSIPLYSILFHSISVLSSHLVMITRNHNHRLRPLLERSQHTIQEIYA